MLHVVADVEREVVPWTIVGVGLIATIEHVVLSDEMSGHRVQSHAQQCANDEVIE